MSGKSAIEALDGSLGHLNFDDPIAAYRGNPLIGALGNIRSKDQIQKLLTTKPPYDPSERRLPSHLRPHVAFQLRKFFVPGIAHMAAVKEADLLIRQTYVDRNPLDLRYRKLMAIDRQRLREECPIPERYTVRSLGSAAIGPPGTGKTLSFDYALRDIPPVIRHAYRVGGTKISFVQIPYLKINLFQDGSTKSFGREIFEQAEHALEVPLIEKWGVRGANDNEIQTRYFQLCREFNVGLFILDEFQLIQASHNGPRKALSYFVRLMNCIGVAVIVVGTTATAKLLKENLAASRRFVGSIPPYAPFSKGPVWTAFFKALSEYQYVEEMDPVDEIRDTVLDLSGGIADLAVKIFLLAQMRLFGRKHERLTSKVLRETADLLFYTVQDRLPELTGSIPEGKDIAELASKADKAFKGLAQKENARVGGDPIPNLDESTPPIEISEIPSGKTSARMKKAAESGDAVKDLEALGVVENCS